MPIQQWELSAVVLPASAGNSLAPRLAQYSLSFRVFAQRGPEEGRVSPARPALPLARESGRGLGGHQVGHWGYIGLLELGDSAHQHDDEGQGQEHER
jgi:hypothetical protein